MAYQLNNFLGCTKVRKFNASLIINKNVCTLYESCPLWPIMIREREKLQYNMDLLKESVRYLDVPVHDSILVEVFKTQ
jgi:hypothetical protein